MRRTKLKYSETTFFGLLKIAGIREFINFSMLFSLIISYLFWKYILIEKQADSFNLIKLSSPIILGSAATIFGISLAALSVTISVFYKPILPKMLESKLLHQYLFPFWKTIGLWGLLIIIEFFLMFITNLNIKNFPYMKADYVLIFTVFLFCYSVFYTIRLTGEVIRLTLQSSQA